MPAKSNIAQFSPAVRRAAVAVQSSQRAAVTKAAAVVQKGAEQTLNAAAPGGRLRNVGAKKLAGGRSGPVKSASGAVLKVATKVTAEASSASALVRAVGGPYAILDLPTRAHWIGQGRSTKRLKAGVEGPFRPGKKTGHAIKIGDNWVMGPVLHPGTKGKHTFAKGTEAAKAEASKVFQETITSAVVKALA